MSCANTFQVIHGGPAPGAKPNCNGPYVIFDPDSNCLYIWDFETEVYEQLCVKGTCQLEVCNTPDLATMQMILCDGADGCKVPILLSSFYPMLLEWMVSEHTLL